MNTYEILMLVDFAHALVPRNLSDAEDAWSSLMAGRRRSSIVQLVFAGQLLELGVLALPTATTIYTCVV